MVILKAVFLPVVLFAPFSSSDSIMSITTSRVAFLLVMATYGAPTGGTLFGAHTKDGDQQHQEEAFLMNVSKETSKPTKDSSGDPDRQSQDKVERGARNLRKLKPKNNKGSEKKGSPQKSNKKGKKGAKVSYVEQSLPVDPSITVTPTPGTPTPENSGGACSQGDQDCVLLFSEDYESPLSDFRNGTLMTDFVAARDFCIKPEGEPDALFYLSKSTEQTLNLAYGKGGNPYDESYLRGATKSVASVAYLKTFKESNAGKSLTFSDDRGGKYAISLTEDLWDNRLRLRFDTQRRKFVAFRMDISSFNDPCPHWAPSALVTAPTEILVSAMSQSSNRTLSHVTVKAERGQSDKFSIVWTRVCNALDVSQAVDGMIFFDWNATKYPALFDNLMVIASNDPNKRPPGC